MLERVFSFSSKLEPEPSLHTGSDQLWFGNTGYQIFLIVRFSFLLVKSVQSSMEGTKANPTCYRKHINILKTKYEYISDEYKINKCFKGII